MVPERQNQRTFLIMSLPYLLLAVLLGSLFIVQASIGFDLGYWADILEFRYVYHELGTRGGLEFEAFDVHRRHILGFLQHTLIHLVSPDNSAAWYGSAIFSHFLTAFFVMLLSDTILRYRHRWLSFAIALFFAFYARHFIELFEFSMRAFIHVALITQILSFWMYLHYVRRKRQNHWWRDWSLVCYALTLNLYETSALYIALYPILAYLGDRENNAISNWRDWLIQIIKDCFWYGFILVFYLFMLMMYLPSDEIDLSIGAISGRIIRALSVEFGIGEIANRLQSAFQASGLFLTLVVGFAIALLSGGWLFRSPQSDIESDTDSSNLQITVLIILGIGMCILNLFVAVQVSLLPPPTSVRTMYPFVAGLAFTVFGILFLILNMIPSRLVKVGIFALVVSLSVAPALTRLLQIQSDYAEFNAGRNQILAAIYETVPDVPRQATPYFVVFTDEASNEAIYSGLRANDFNLPRLFIVEYGTGDFGFDLVRYDLPNIDATDENNLREGSPYIIADEDGIYSTLRAAPIGTTYEPNPPEDLIILYYDGITGEAEILDEAPAELLEIANIFELSPTDWQTNYDLLTD